MYYIIEFFFLFSFLRRKINIIKICVYEHLYTGTATGASLSPYRRSLLIGIDHMLRWYSVRTGTSHYYISIPIYVCLVRGSVDAYERLNILNVNTVYLPDLWRAFYSHYMNHVLAIKTSRACEYNIDDSVHLIRFIITAVI